MLRRYSAARCPEYQSRALEEEMAEVAMECRMRVKQLILFFSAAGIGTRDGWGAASQVQQARTKAYKAAEPTQPTKATGKGKAKRQAAKAKPAPQPGRWVDWDCNAELNMQRIGEAKWRSLELCWWPDLPALLAQCKEYPGLGYKRLQDRPPKTQQQHHPVAQ
ncbi:hypothetical protein QJQ45_001699 [Haematococcus lacustris]|nr:hypothetical protein QJQ45_001699 [Haematococcus lacustris]